MFHTFAIGITAATLVLAAVFVPATGTGPARWLRRLLLGIGLLSVGLAAGVAWHEDIRRLLPQKNEIVRVDSTPGEMLDSEAASDATVGEAPLTETNEETVAIADAGQRT